MSAEYELKLSSPLVSLKLLASSFDDLGLAAASISDDCLTLARPGTDAKQLSRWGGDIEITKQSDHLFVIINSVGLTARVLERIRAILVREGIESKAEEV